MCDSGNAGGDARKGERMSRADFSFETLLAPVRPRDFCDRYWEKEPLVIRRHADSYYGAVFCLDDVDKYLIAGKDSVRPVALVPPPDQRQASRRHRLSELSLDAVYDAFCRGETIRLESIQECWPAVTNLAAHVGGALGTGVNVNAYITPAHSQGLSVHFDTHDVFILQVDGSKDWWIYEPEVHLPIEAPTYLTHLGAVGEKKVEEDPSRLIRRLTLETGDLLYIPRGFPHKAITGDRPSVHLAVALAPVYWVDLVRTAVERLCIDRPELRRALTPGFLDDAGVRQSIQSELAALLRTCAEQVSADHALDLLIHNRIAACRYPADGHFAELARLATLTVGDVLERRPGMKCSVASSNEGVSIRFAHNEVRGPHTVAPIFEHVRDHQRFRIADLPGPLSDDSKLVLGRRLVREGLLRRATPIEAEPHEKAGLSDDDPVPARIPLAEEHADEAGVVGTAS
jgi:ribosomal protein L16 Arg81 hydroxylase